MTRLLQSFSPAQAALLRIGIFDAQLLSALGLLGLIWFVQLVHYPLFARVPAPEFATYEARHATRTGWLAAPLMVTELLTALLLLNGAVRGTGITPQSARLGAALTAVTWLSTFVLQVPLHRRLHHGFDAVAIRRLVATNWVRTVAWTLKAALLLYWVDRLRLLS